MKSIQEYILEQQDKNKTIFLKKFMLILNAYCFGTSYGNKYEFEMPKFKNTPEYILSILEKLQEIQDKRQDNGLVIKKDNKEIDLVEASKLISEYITKKQKISYSTDVWDYAFHTGGILINGTVSDLSIYIYDFAGPIKKWEDYKEA